MFRYDLNNLPPEEFAKLCNALLVNCISDGVRPFDTVGSDAGRDCDYEGAGKGDYAHLTGYWVFQYKHHDVARSGVKQARQSVRSDVLETLTKLCAPGKRAVDNFFLITNVPFSGVITTGTHDWFNEVVSQTTIKHAEVWDYTKLESLIDAHYEIHKTFSPHLTYTSDFFKQIADRVSSSVLWEALERLFQASGSGDPVFATRADYESAKNLLWELYEGFSLVESGLATITNYVYSWPEFIEMAQIAVQNPEYEITLGEGHLIKHGGTAVGGSRNIWSVLRGIIEKIEHHSSMAHRQVLEIAERSGTIGRIIAEESRSFFMKQGAMSLFRSANTLVTPLQFHRFSTVEQVLESLDQLITHKEQGHRGSLEGARAATASFHNAILLTAGMRHGVKSALMKLDSSMVIKDT